MCIYNILFKFFNKLLKQREISLCPLFSCSLSLLLPGQSLSLSLTLLPQKLQQLAFPGSLPALFPDWTHSHRRAAGWWGRGQGSDCATWRGSQIGCHNQRRTDRVLPLECSIHLTIPLPVGSSYTTGLYPSACWWVPKFLKKLFQHENDWENSFNILAVNKKMKIL